MNSLAKATDLVKVTEISVEELANGLELLYWKKGVDRLKITEDFSVSGKCTYIVERLTIDVEEDLVCCWCKDMMKNGVKVMNMFLRSCLVAINRVVCDYKTCVVLEFNDGRVWIEVC